MIVQMQVPVSQAAYDLGVKLAQLISAVKALPPGSSVVADAIAVAGPIIGELPQLISDMQQLSADEKADLMALSNGIAMGIEEVVKAILK